MATIVNVPVVVVCVCVCSGCLCVCVACSCGACCGVRRFMTMKLLSGSTTLMRDNTKRTQKIQRESEKGVDKNTHIHMHLLIGLHLTHIRIHTLTIYREDELLSNWRIA